MLWVLGALVAKLVIDGMVLLVGVASLLVFAVEARVRRGLRFDPVQCLQYLVQVLVLVQFRLLTPRVELEHLPVLALRLAGGNQWYVFEALPRCLLGESALQGFRGLALVLLLLLRRFSLMSGGTGRYWPLLAAELVDSFEPLVMDWPRRLGFAQHRGLILKRRMAIVGVLYLRLWRLCLLLTLRCVVVTAARAPEEAQGPACRLASPVRRLRRYLIVDRPDDVLFVSTEKLLRVLVAAMEHVPEALLRELFLLLPLKPQRFGSLLCEELARGEAGRSVVLLVVADLSMPRIRLGAFSHLAVLCFPTVLLLG